MQIQAGATGVSIPVKVQDSSSSVGAGLSGLVFNTAGLVASYWRQGGTRTAIALATLAAIDSVWSSGGFKEAEATHLKGSYRLDVPNAAFAAGADWVIIELYGATNMQPVTLRVDLVGWNPQETPSTDEELADTIAAQTDIATLITNVVAILADTGTDGVKVNLSSMILRKNAAFSNFPFKMVDATDGFTAEPGVTVTATRSIDGAAFGACANAVSEIANGYYKINLAASDLNGSVIILRFTATGCRATEIVIFTNPETA